MDVDAKIRLIYFFSYKVIQRKQSKTINPFLRNYRSKVTILRKDCFRFKFNTAN